MSIVSSKGVMRMPFRAKIFQSYFMFWPIFRIEASSRTGFKAASTLDSMLGYRSGRLRWLGTAGARLDDLLVWLPCRLVALSLPLAAGQGLRGCGRLWRRARRDGAPDPSPNAGLSQAAYAHCTGVQLGGLNRYGDQLKAKPLLAAGQPLPSAASVERMLALTGRLELLWLLPIAALAVGTQ